MTRDKNQWQLLCAFTVLPLTAILHNLVFYRSTCMLNPFGEEALSTYLTWLSRDPSIPWAIVCAGIVYAAGKRQPPLKTLVRPFVIGFSPLSIWIWDIPMSGRIICKSFHDDKLVLPILGPLHSKHLYILGMIVSLGILMLQKKKSPTFSRTDRIGATQALA